MLVQNNLNNQSFNGRIAIVDELSAEPCKYVRKILPRIKSLIQDKPFDLFIKENYKDNNISFIAQKPHHFGKKNKPISEYTVSKNIGLPNTETDIEHIYLGAAKNTIDNYRMSEKNNSIMKKFKYCLSRIGFAINNNSNK